MNRVFRVAGLVVLAVLAGWSGSARAAERDGIPVALERAVKAWARAKPKLMECHWLCGMVRMRSDLTFASGSTDVRPDAKQALSTLVTILKTPEGRRFNLYVAGHTDDVPVSNPSARKRHPNNWYLSVHRAVGIQKVLVGAGLAPDRIAVMGFGEYRPIVPNKPGRKGNAANRRIELWIVPSGGLAVLNRTRGRTGTLPKGEASLVLRLGTSVSMKLALIPAGTFMMGSPKTETGRDDDEGPQRQVTLTRPFHMGTTEVTQAQWQAVMGTQPWDGRKCARAGADNAASYINWNDATAFCKALSTKTGRTVRLPTEAEWECACRAGSTAAFSFGDDASTLGDRAWYGGNAHDKDEKYAHPAGAKKPNAWRLHDMHGNVYEWCAEWYADSYAKADTRDPKGPATGKVRVLRGGSWLNVPRNCRAAARNKLTPDDRHFHHGFRVVVEADRKTNYELRDPLTRNRILKTPGGTTTLLDGLLLPWVAAFGGGAGGVPTEYD